MTCLSFQLDRYVDIDDKTVMFVLGERVSRKRAYRQSAMAREVAAMVLPCTKVYSESGALRFLLQAGW